MFNEQSLVTGFNIEDIGIFVPSKQRKRERLSLLGKLYTAEFGKVSGSSSVKVELCIRQLVLDIQRAQGCLISFGIVCDYRRQCIP